MPKRRKCTIKSRKGNGKKKQGCHINGGTDMISDLPDSVLAHILGKLSTKYAVGTSILSTRWKHLFALIPDLDISINDYERLKPDPEYSDSNFNIIYHCRMSNLITFMHNLLNVTLKDVPRLRKLHLDLNIDYVYEQTHRRFILEFNEHISKWVSAALRLNVSYLCVSCPSYRGTPENLFSCASLVELMLNWGAGVCVPSSVCLPNLKSLYLKSVWFHVNDLERILAGCHMLEELSLWKCNFEERNIRPLTHTVRIVSPSVKNFKMRECYRYCKYGLELDLPALEFLVFDDYVPEYILVKNLNSLRKAHVDAWPTYEYEQLEGTGLGHYLKVVADLIGGCTNVEFLSLPIHSNQFLTQGTGYSLPSLCTLYNLIELELHRIEGYGWMLLAHLLKNAPNLEVLVFREGFDVSEGFYQMFTSHMSEQFPTLLCLNLQLIKFEKFTGEVDEMQLLKYFLKNGKLVREIEIDIDFFSCSYVVEVESNILELQKSSKSCAIDFLPRLERYDSDRYFGNMKKLK